MQDRRLAKYFTVVRETYSVLELLEKRAQINANIHRERRKARIIHNAFIYFDVSRLMVNSTETLIVSNQGTGEKS